jgi:L-asparaginase
MAQNSGLPTVVALATGGTIAGQGSAGKATNYRPGQIDVNTLLKLAEPESAIANVRGEQVCNVNSDDITSAHWVELASAINRLAADPEIDGFVVTHGTDTLEETAYFLNLTVKTDKPVVITGAMRPATATSADGPMNLHQSIALAGNPVARGKGVLVVFSDGIFGWRDVRKISTIQTDAFSANDFGCMGYMVDGVPHIFNAPVKPHTLATEFGAAVAEMEGAAIAQTAWQNGTPCAIVRAISDLADGSATLSFEEFEVIAAERSAKLLLEICK